MSSSTTAAEYLSYAGLELAKALDIPYTMREQLALTAFLDAYARQQVEAFRERAARTAEMTEELEGPIPPDVLMRTWEVGIAEGLRASVRATKKEIAAAIRALTP